MDRRNGEEYAESCGKQHRKCFDLVCIPIRRDYVFRFRMVLEGWCSTRRETVIGSVELRSLCEHCALDCDVLQWLCMEMEAPVVHYCISIFAQPFIAALRHLLGLRLRILSHSYRILSLNPTAQFPHFNHSDNFSHWVYDWQ